MRKFLLFLLATVLLSGLMLSAGAFTAPTAAPTLIPAVSLPPNAFPPTAPTPIPPPLGPTPAPIPTAATSKPPAGKPWNTYATSEGPLFTSFNAKLTDLKLMFTPLDLSVDGEYTFPLIAAGSREVGQVEVKVEGGLVTARLHANKGVSLIQPVKPTQPMLFFFPDIASVKTVRPGQLQHLRLPFDKQADVVKELKYEDQKVLMYVYALISMSPGADTKPFFLTDPAYLERVEAFKLLMD